MELLQAKSLKGLYLRLLFWINQICKNLLVKKDNVSFTLPKSKTNVVKSIIMFLSFMRDVVSDLESKKVTNIDNYEWQRQLRMNWNADENTCRVDCGGYSIWQQNEYVGSNNRLTLSPITNRYFVFISSALREKSAILLKTIPNHRMPFN